MTVENRPLHVLTLATGGGRVNERYGDVTPTILAGTLPKERSFDVVASWPTRSGPGSLHFLCRIGLSKRARYLFAILDVANITYAFAQSSEVLFESVR